MHEIRSPQLKQKIYIKKKKVDILVQLA